MKDGGDISVSSSSFSRVLPPSFKLYDCNIMMKSSFDLTFIDLWLVTKRIYILSLISLLKWDYVWVEPNPTHNCMLTITYQKIKGSPGTTKSCVSPIYVKLNTGKKQQDEYLNLNSFPQTEDTGSLIDWCWHLTLTSLQCK